MKTFREYLKETHLGEPLVTVGSPSLLNPELIDNINADFDWVTRGCFVSPYRPLTKVKEVLEKYHINIVTDNSPLDADGGEIITPVSQYGDPSSPEADSGFYFYFAYALENGVYEVHAEITTQEGLDDILSNGDDEEPLEINEISNTKVQQYVKKSNEKFKQTLADFGKARETGNEAEYKKGFKVIKKRERGLKLSSNHFKRNRAKPVTEAFDEKAAFDSLRKEYAKIDRVDPTGPAYQKMKKLLDSMDQAQLKKLVDAKIKWLSTLALNRIK